MPKTLWSTPRTVIPRIRCIPVTVATSTFFVLILASVLVPLKAKSNQGFHLINSIDFTNFSTLPLYICHLVAPPPNPDQGSCNNNQNYAYMLLENYVRYKRILGMQAIRPFTFNQQTALMELLEVHGIAEHQYSLDATVKLTQRLEPQTLSEAQQRQMVDWRQSEGAILNERACRGNSKLREKTIQALRKMGMYNSLIPTSTLHDYTLFLGGNIQDMQLRMITLLNAVHMNKGNQHFDLGEVLALTCDRLIDAEEYDHSPGTTFLDIIEENGTPMVLVDDDERLALTETTAFEAIHYSLKQFCNDDTFFFRHQKTLTGYHPSLPVSFLSDTSHETDLYRKIDGTFQLTEHFRTAACDFIEKYPKPNFYETRQTQEGAEKLHRPTTKETVKMWLNYREQLVCKNEKLCEFLAISNAPHSLYQHVAVLQGLEESILVPTKIRYRLTTSGAGASTDIPTDYLLDNLTKILYLEGRRPSR